MKIEFTFNYKILFLFIFPIVFQFDPFITQLYVKEQKDYLLFRIFRIFLSQLLFIVFILIIKCRTTQGSSRSNSESGIGENNKKEKKILSQVEIELEKNNSKKFRRNILILFGLSALDLIAFFINYFYYNEPGIKIYLNTMGFFLKLLLLVY